MFQRILTPAGYRDIADITVGDEVVAYDMVTGEELINQVEGVSLVDEAEWQRWYDYPVNQDIPPFRFYLINGTWRLNSEQSIWRNGTSVCHAKHLVVGDTIYDDQDNAVLITSIEEVYEPAWWRFDISGDHSYICDGLTLHNASRFWVGGTGTLDSSDTTHWAASSGAAGGQSVPGSADTVTLDGSSGGGTVTVNFGGLITWQSLTCGAFTGTLDFSANNNSITLTASSGFNGSGSGTRTINLGNGTWTLNHLQSTWTLTTVTNLTFAANSSTINFSNTGGSERQFNSGGRTYNIVTFASQSGAINGGITITGAATITTLTIGAGFTAMWSATLVVTNFTCIGTPVNPVGLSASTPAGGGVSLSVASGTVTIEWAIQIRGVSFTGGATWIANNSYNFGATGITVRPPKPFPGSRIQLGQ